MEAAASFPVESRLKDVAIYRLRVGDNPNNNNPVNLAGLIEQIIEACNKPLRTDSLYQKMWDDKPAKLPNIEGFALTIYVRQVEHFSAAAKALVQVAPGKKQSLQDRTVTTIYFLWRSVPIPEVFALTSGKVGQAFKRHADPDFPWKIARRVAVPEFTYLKTSSYADGSKTAITSPKPIRLVDHEIESLWRVITSYRGALRQDSSVHDILGGPKGVLEKEVRVSISTGKVKLHTAISLETYWYLLNHFSCINNGDVFQNGRGKSESDQPAWSYLGNVDRVDDPAKQQRLDNALFELIPMGIRQKSSTALSFSARYESHFAKAPSVSVFCEQRLQHRQSPPFPTLNSLLNWLNNTSLAPEEIRKLGLGFADERDVPLGSFLRGTICLDDVVYFYLEGSYYHIKASAIPVIRRQFYRMIQPDSDLVLRPEAEGVPSLKPWKQGMTEPEYNRQYADQETAFLYGDGILAADTGKVELFDLAYFGEGSIYLYQVKVDFNKNIGNGCRQIRTAASLLSDRSGKALRGFYQAVCKTTGTKKRQELLEAVRRQFRRKFGEQDTENAFLNTFSEKRIIFVLAFVDNNTQEQRLLSSEPDPSKGNSKLESNEARLEIIALKQDLVPTGFGLRICQIQRQ